MTNSAGEFWGRGQGGEFSDSEEKACLPGASDAKLRTEGSGGAGTADAAEGLRWREGRRAPGQDLGSHVQKFEI